MLADVVVKNLDIGPLRLLNLLLALLLRRFESLVIEGEHRLELLANLVVRPLSRRGREESALRWCGESGMVGNATGLRHDNGGEKVDARRVAGLEARVGEFSHGVADPDRFGAAHLIRPVAENAAVSVHGNSPVFVGDMIEAAEEKAARWREVSLAAWSAGVAETRDAPRFAHEVAAHRSMWDNRPAGRDDCSRAERDRHRGSDHNGGAGQPRLARL